jgi:hypothetical protein
MMEDKIISKTNKISLKILGLKLNLSNGFIYKKDSVIFDLGEDNIKYDNLKLHTFLEGVLFGRFQVLKEMQRGGKE